MNRFAKLWLTPLVAAAVLLGGCSTTPEDQPDRQAAELYNTARAARERGDFQMAVDRLEELEAKYPFGVYAEQAQLDIIYAYYKQGETDSAVAAADRFIRLNPRHPKVDYAYYMKGVAEQERGSNSLQDWFNLKRYKRDPEPLHRAFNSFRTLIQRFPESDFVADARERMKAIRAKLAEHELYVARFYAERNAWVAAANRASTIVTRYPKTPSVDGALELLKQSYDKLGAEGLSEDVMRVIRLNLPNKGG